MKKKLESESKLFLPVALHKEDLDEIVEILTTDGKKIQFADDSFEYDSLDELRSRRGEKLNIFEVRTSYPSVVLKITRSTTYLYRSGDASTISPFSQIEQILKRRKRKVVATLFDPILCILFVAFVIFLTYHFNLSENLKALILAPLIFGSVLVVIAVRAGSIFSRVYLVEKHQQQSFFSRNRDAIIVGIFTTIVSSALSFFVAYLLFRRGIK